MGGKRSVKVWLEPPQYHHSACREDYRGKYSEQGWSYDNHYGRSAKPLFKQDPNLLTLVWDKIIWSLLPKGKSLEEGLIWFDQPDSTPPRKDELFNDVITNYNFLFEDKNWEAKCNLCHKRFILKVDVRSLTSEFIAPLVEYSDSHTWVRTMEITPYLATRYWVPKGSSDIPF